MICDSLNRDTFFGSANRIIFREELNQLVGREPKLTEIDQYSTTMKYSNEKSEMIISAGSVPGDPRSLFIRNCMVANGSEDDISLYDDDPNEWQDLDGDVEDDVER